MSTIPFLVKVVFLSLPISFFKSSSMSLISIGIANSKVLIFAEINSLLLFVFSIFSSRFSSIFASSTTTEIALIVFLE